MLDFFVQFFTDYGYFAVFGILILCGFGLPVPEDITLVSGGVISGLGYTNVHFMFFVGLAGVLIGDATMFLAGRLFGYRIQRIRLFRRILSPRRFSQIQRKFKKYGLGLLFVARFLPGLRSPIYLVSGMSRRVSFITFILMDGMAALISVPVWIYLGYFFADNLDLLMVYVGDVQKAIYLALGLVIAIILVIYLKKRFHSKLNAIAGDEHTENTSSKTSSNTVAAKATVNISNANTANTAAFNAANSNTAVTNTAMASAQLANSSAQTLNSTLSAASNTESVKVASTAQTAIKPEAQTITQTASETSIQVTEQATNQSAGQSSAHSSEQATASNANASGLNTAESNVAESNNAQTTEQSNDDGSSKDNGSAETSASAIASARANSDGASSESLSQSQNTSTKADHKVELSPCGERAAKSTIREANSTVRIDPATESHEEILGKKIKDKKLISQLSKASSLAASGRGHSQFNPGLGRKTPQ